MKHSAQSHDSTKDLLFPGRMPYHLANLASGNPDGILCALYNTFCTIVERSSTSPSRSFLSLHLDVLSPLPDSLLFVCKETLPGAWKGLTRHKSKDCFDGEITCWFSPSPCSLPPATTKHGLCAF